MPIIGAVKGDLSRRLKKLATFKKSAKAKRANVKVLLEPIMRDDKTIAVRVTSIGIGDCGAIDVKSTAPDDPDIR
ncbi:MAG: hypothetical protein ACLP8A_13620 [Methylovirgula sp.]